MGTVKRIPSGQEQLDPWLFLSLAKLVYWVGQPPGIAPALNDS